MAATMLLGALFGLLPVPQEPEPAPASPVEQRARDDLRAACEALLEQRIAFTGSCRFTALKGSAPDDDAPIPFRGAWDRGLALLQVLDFTVLSHGEHQCQRRGDGAWTRPQGDAPDLPLSPRALARHLATAAITAPEPVFVDDRPAMRVRAEWLGAAATALVRDTSHPHGKSQQLLERLPIVLDKRPAESNCIDAAVCYDPATRTLRSAVLRVALLHDQDLPTTDEPDPAPEGLPVLGRRVMLQFTFTLTLVPPDQVPLPAIAALGERLQWPPPPADAAAEPKPSVR